MRKILVTGASGFIGIEVARQLDAAKTSCRLMVRRAERRVFLDGVEAETVPADLENPHTLTSALRDVDTVIHLGARAAFQRYRALYPSIVKGSVNLMRAGLEAGVRHFIFAGTLLAYSGGPSPVDQRTPAHPQSAYGQVKHQAEHLLGQMADRAGIRFVSLRLPHVYGAYSLLFDQIRRGRVLFPGSGANHFAHLHVRDAARALIQAARSDLCGTYVLGDNRSCSWKTFFETARRCYPRMRMTYLPRAFAMLGACLVEAGLKTIGRPTPWPYRAIQMWNLNLPVVPGTVKSVLGMEPAYPRIEDGLPAAFREALPMFWRPSNLDVI